MSEATSAKPLLIGPGTIVTGGPDSKVVIDGGVLIEGELIKEVGDFHTLATAHRAAERLDADGRLILPGLINAHSHLYSTFLRGMPSMAEPLGRPGCVAKNNRALLARHLLQEDGYLAAVTSLIAGLRRGTTTWLDLHDSPTYRDATPLGALEELGQAFLDIGARGCLGYAVSERDGETITLAAISENERFIEQCREGLGGGRLVGVLGLDATGALSDLTVESLRQVNDYLRAGFHFQGAAGIPGIGLARLSELGVMGELTVVAGGAPSAAEIGIAAETKTALVVCPAAKLAAGEALPDLRRLLEAKTIVGLGTDHESGDLGEAARIAGATADAAAAAGLILTGNPAAASRFFPQPVGVLAAGALADVAVFDYYSPTPLLAAGLAEHLLAGALRSAAWHVVVHGETLVRETRLVRTIDEEALAAHAREHAEDLWKRMQAR